MKKNCYIIGSAIVTDTSQGYDVVDRWMATLATVDSINARDRNAEIFILETGSKKCPAWMDDRFPKNVKIYNWQFDSRVNEIRAESKKYGDLLSSKYSIKGKDKEFTKRFLWTAYIKSATESYAILKFFQMHDLSEYDKVFKISGRYILNNEFDLSNYENKWTFKHQSTLSDGTENISSVLWCFRGEHEKEFKQKWKNTYNWLVDAWKVKHECKDLESSIYHGFGNTDEERQFTFIKPLGVMGIVNSPDKEEKLKIVAQ